MAASHHCLMGRDLQRSVMSEMNSQQPISITGQKKNKALSSRQIGSEEHHSPVMHVCNGREEACPGWLNLANSYLHSRLIQCEIQFHKCGRGRLSASVLIFSSIEQTGRERCTLTCISLLQAGQEVQQTLSKVRGVRGDFGSHAETPGTGSVFQGEQRAAENYFWGRLNDHPQVFAASG